MSTTTLVPGIYIEEDASPAISVSQGATAVPLFIAAFTPINNDDLGKIIRISSWLDFCQKFSVVGGLSAAVTITSTSTSALAEGAAFSYSYAIGTVNVIENTAPLALKLYFQNGGNACYVFPLQSVSDSALLSKLPELMDKQGDITLISVPANESTYRDAVYAAVASSLEQNKGYFLLVDSSDGRPVTTVGSSSHVAVYYPALTCHAAAFLLSDSEVSISGYKDANNTVGTEINTLKALKAVNAKLATEVSAKLAEKMPTSLTIHPSALMAGVYCKTDLTRGVWKAPANVVLTGVSDVSVRVTDDAQGSLNQAGINVIRYFSDRGVVVWGARTLQDDDNWRYIPVRRLFDAVERDVKKAMRPMVFEPNNQMTWARVKIAVENYLYRLWQQGGLAGNKAEEAYFVRIGKDITMTTDEINQGKMIVQIGMAAVRPAEFIILQFTQNMSQ